MVSFSFEDPGRLWLLLAAIPVAVVGLRWFRAMIMLRRVTAVGARIVLFALIVGMLAGARRVRETESLTTIAVIDLSQSVMRFSDLGPEPATRIREFLRASTDRRGPDDLFGLVVFDGKAIAAAVPSRANVLDRSLEPPGVEGSNISAALRYAAALAPADSTTRLVLISDGNDTAGDAIDAAAELAGAGFGSGLSIDVVPIDHRVGDEVVVESFDAPPRAAPGSTIPLRVVLRSTASTQGTLYLAREGEALDINGSQAGYGRRIQLEPGRNIELINVPLPPGRVHRFEVSYEPDRDGTRFVGDTTLANNRSSAFTLVPGRGSVLFVDGVSNGSPDGEGATLPRALAEADIDVQVVSPDGFPQSMLELQSYDLVVFQNVPAEALDDRQQEMLISHVQDVGAGLVMIGGPDAFGAGGWHGSLLEPIMPIRLDLPDQIIVPEAAIMFVLDSSGSMGASVLGSVRTQQEVANESAAMAIQSLDRTDLVGVIAFNESYRTVVPLGPNTDPEQAAARVRSIAPGGGTTLGPALRAAAEALASDDAKTKQIIVLSDGRSTDAVRLEEQARQINELGIRITAIAVGDAADSDTLERVAMAGGGAFYSVINPNLLPRIFLKAVRVVRSPLVREGSFDVRINDAGSPLIAGIEQPPPLRGLVMSRFREEPTVVNALIASTGDPLLSHWVVGLGQVVAFTSDAHHWAERWVDWPGYRAFWTQIMRMTSRAVDESDSELIVEVTGGTLDVVLDAFDRSGTPADLLDVPASVYLPGGGVEEITLAQTGPGRYEASLPARESGAYIVIARPRLGGKRLPPLLGGASVPVGTEMERLEANTALLVRIAELTGGRVLDIHAPTPGALFAREQLVPRRASTPLWPTLLAWALLVYLVDVGTRRVAWDRFISRSFGADLRREIGESVRWRESVSVGVLKAKIRATKLQTAQGTALDEEDAKRVAEQVRQRRREAYQSALRSARLKSDQQDTTPAQAAEEQMDGPESALLAAKRRARQRFEGESSDE